MELVENIKKCSTGGNREKGNILTYMKVKFPIINICPVKFQPRKRPSIWNISLYKFKSIDKQCFSCLETIAFVLEHMNNIGSRKCLYKIPMGEP